MSRPGHYGEDPDAVRPKLKLFSLNPLTVYGGIGLLIMLKWFLSTL